MQLTRGNLLGRARQDTASEFLRSVQPCTLRLSHKPDTACLRVAVTVKCRQGRNYYALARPHRAEALSDDARLTSICLSRTSGL